MDPHAVHPQPISPVSVGFTLSHRWHTEAVGSSTQILARGDHIKLPWKQHHEPAGMANATGDPSGVIAGKKANAERAAVSLPGGR